MNKGSTRLLTSLRHFWYMAQEIRFRSSRPEVFCKKGVHRNFAKFTGKHLCQSLFFNKVAVPATLLKKNTLEQVFSCEFCEISKNAFCYRTPLVTASSVYTCNQDILWQEWQIEKGKFLKKKYVQELQPDLDEGFKNTPDLW